MNKSFSIFLFFLGLVLWTVSVLHAFTIGEKDDYGYDYAGQYQNQQIYGKKYYVMDQNQTYEWVALRVGESSQNYGGNLYQSNGIILANQSYPIIGQSLGGTESAPCKSLYQMSGTARSFIYGQNGLYIATAKNDVGTLEVKDSAKTWIQDIRLGSGGNAFQSSAYVVQSGGTVYAPTLTRANIPQYSASYTHDYQYKLSGGELFVGKISDNDKGLQKSSTDSTVNDDFMHITGGTLVFQTSEFPIVNQGGTIEIYGRLNEALTRTDHPTWAGEQNKYTYADFKADKTPKYTTYGTSTLKYTKAAVKDKDGNITAPAVETLQSYTQKSGTLALDYRSSTEYDKMVASSVDIQGGTILVRPALDTQIDSNPVYKPFEGVETVTVADSVTINGGLPGWKWAYDSANKQFTVASDIGTFNNSTTSISGDKDMYTSGSNAVDTNQTISISGGVLTTYRSAYFGRGGNCTVNQTGGIVFNAVPASATANHWFVLNESSGEKQTIWTMKNDAKFYSTSGTKIIVGKSQLGKFDIQDSAVFHVNNIKLGTNFTGNDYTKQIGRGVIDQSGNSQVYINNLWMVARTTSYSTSAACEYNLNGGTLVINQIAYDANFASLSIKPVVNLNGGTFSLTESKDPNMVFKLNGATIDIRGNVANALSDFSYLNDGSLNAQENAVTTVSTASTLSASNDTVGVPGGFTDYGTMKVTGGFTFENGTIKMDISSDGSQFDTLEIDGTVTAASPEDVKIFLNYDGTLQDLYQKPIRLFVGDSLLATIQQMPVTASNPALNLDAISFSNGFLTVNGNYVPEPATWLLLVVGAGLLWVCKRK